FLKGLIRPKDLLDSCRYVPCRDTVPKRTVMSRGLKRAVVILFGVIVLFQFNNCGGYETSEPAVDTSSLLPACESETDCVVETNLNLKVQPLPVDNFPVTAALAAFNIGGECNEAGFATNRIIWSLKRNNATVRTS